jgi:flagellar motor switch protein FliN/FliY
MTVTTHEAQAPDLQNEARFASLLQIAVPVSVQLGRCRMSLQEVLNLAPGDRVSLDRLADEPVELLANGHPVAQGEVVVIGGNFGIRITKIQSAVQRLRSLG